MPLPAPCRPCPCSLRPPPSALWRVAYVVLGVTPKTAGRAALSISGPRPGEGTGKAVLAGL